MVRMFFRARRRIRSEWRGLKSLIKIYKKNKKVKTTAMVLYKVYTISSIIRNPFKIIDVGLRYIMT
tara:strand:+ start:9229 stop:9426 length:198 start_codon:yes stop_codon:yes gene_type:complete